MMELRVPQVRPGLPERMVQRVYKARQVLLVHKGQPGLPALKVRQEMMAPLGLPVHKGQQVQQGAME